MQTGWRESGPEAAERALVRRMLAGEEAAFDAFSAAYLPVVYRFAQRRLGDRELTREIVQSTVCKAIAKLGSFRGEAGLATWLCACCRNEIAAHFRRLGRPGHEVALEGEVAAAVEVPGAGLPGPEQALLRKERAALVHAALDELPPHYGRALEWKYLDRLSVEEIAGRLGVGAKAAESLLTRARQAFKAAFGRLGAGAGAATAAERGEAEERSNTTAPWAPERVRD
jgi:RNA polymerase sigma-70 factor (ECF subfamily)